MFCGVCQRDVPEDTIHRCAKAQETFHPAADVDATTWACPSCGKGLLEKA